MTKIDIGTLLLQGNFISSQEEISELKEQAEEREESFIATVVRKKKRSFVEIANYFSSKLHLPYIDLDLLDLSFLPPDVDLKILETTKILPLKKSANAMMVATSDPTNSAIDDIKFQVGVSNIIMVIVEENKLNKMIEKYMQLKGTTMGSAAAAESILEGLQEVEAIINVEPDVEDAPIVKFINKVLLEAIKLKVSDIHFEPYEKTYRVRFRLDGVLFQSKTVPLGAKESIASRIKVMSQMDISEKRAPQDGRLKIPLSADKSIDFRVSTLPTLWGEKIVMRILDSSSASLNIDKLGYTPHQKELLLEAVKRPYGMVLVTGPTGSGKTLSLYSCINILNNEGVNICTAEDPVEINLPGINQVNMNEKANLTFETALKAFLRQDPDTILVGEIRDLETADIAIKAAQTGHMVLSTLHTNDAPKTITRLLAMGVKPFNVASSVVLITAQRLVRKLCPHCKEEETLPESILLDAGFKKHELEGYGTTWKTYKPVGCDECHNKGYKGRMGVYQVLPITEKIRSVILNEGNDLDIANIAREEGIKDLRESGLEKVQEGHTSLEEVVATTNIE